MKLFSSVWLTVLESLLNTAKLAANLTKTPIDNVLIECGLAVVAELKAIAPAQATATNAEGQ